MYEGVKKAFGPKATKVVPLKSALGDIITDRAKQMEKWAKHYQELNLWENTVTETAIKNTNLLPVMEVLDVPPSAEELSKELTPWLAVKL